MTPACVKLWTRCLQDLQQLPALTNDPAALTETDGKLQATLTQWGELPPLSERDWRRLVLEIKVGGGTCTLQRQPGQDSSCPVQLEDYFSTGSMYPLSS